MRYVESVVLFLLKEKVRRLQYSDARKPEICASHCAGFALPTCLKYWFICFTVCALSRADGWQHSRNIFTILSATLSPKCGRLRCAFWLWVGSDKRSLAATGAFYLPNVRASADLRKKCLLAKLIAAETKKKIRNVKKIHVGKEDE